MSPKPDSKDETKSQAAKGRLPFEPKNSRKKNSPPGSSAPKAAASSPKKKQRTPITKEDRVIPKVVSNRMIRRMSILSGIPTSLGILTFVASYWIITQVGLELPNFVVVLTSMGFFGLGVVGLSYGVLSASWDEDRVGTLLGWQDFTLNLRRTIEAWRSVKQNEYTE